MDTKTNRTLTAALSLALAAGLTACGAPDDGTGAGAPSPSAEATTGGTAAATTEDDEDTGDLDDSDDTAEGSTATGDGAASGGDLNALALEGIATAEAETGGTAYQMDDQDDDGTWEVDVAVGDRSIEVTVSADGLTVLETEDDDLDDDDRAGLEVATITLRDAVEAAVAEVGGTLDGTELEEQGDTHLWEVVLDQTAEGDDDVEVHVDVTNGEVVKVDR